MASAFELTSDDADSMRSGRKVPCARKVSSGLRPSSSVIRADTCMKVSPMMRRLSSGAVVSRKGLVVYVVAVRESFTTVVPLRKSSSQSYTRSFTPSVFSDSPTKDDSFMRMKPLSMCAATTFSGPKAFASNAQQTVLSTPPETRQSTIAAPTLSRICFKHCSSRDAGVNDPRHAQTPNKKLRNIAMPLSERSTSGWNCRPYNFFSSLAMPAQSMPLLAMVRKPSATLSTLSPWVRSTRCVLFIPANKGQSVITSISS
mmetsp:Transcript_94212/g.266043  ORF Transcript_94212/g.266043 Transcript_94212/m.266043 type:complete len:258 (-) Transcript_94212:443-1216(-)